MTPKLTRSKAPEVSSTLATTTTTTTTTETSSLDLPLRHVEANVVREGRKLWIQTRAK